MDEIIISVTAVYRDNRKIINYEKKEIDLNEIDYIDFGLSETIIHFLNGDIVEIEESDSELRKIIQGR